MAKLYSLYPAVLGQVGGEGSEGGGREVEEERGRGKRRGERRGQGRGEQRGGKGEGNGREKRMNG